MFGMIEGVVMRAGGGIDDVNSAPPALTPDDVGDSLTSLCFLKKKRKYCIVTHFSDVPVATQSADHHRQPAPKTCG